MEVRNARSCLLTNAEVYRLCEHVQTQQRKTRSERAKNLSTLLYETCKYLEKTPGVGEQNNDFVKELFEATKEFKLTKAEFLQIVNLRPETPVEIQLIVEECEERLSEEQVDSLLEKIKNIVPAIPREKSESPMEQDS